MRTTVTLDPDVLEMLREEMKRTDRCLEQVLNEAVRCGLARTSPGTLKPFRTEPRSFGFKPEINLNRLNHLLEDQEVEELRGRYNGAE